MKRYKNGRTVFGPEDLSILSPERDKAAPITEGQRALLEAIIASSERPAEPRAQPQEPNP